MQDLIPPHGGVTEPINRNVPDAEAKDFRQKAASLKKVPVSDADLSSLYRMGDGGLSHRESLALFGFPLSEPFVDPDTGLLTQYFERAVFELHPENPEPYRVLLRRLGAEELARWDW